MKLGSVRYYGYLIPLLTLFSCDNNLEVQPAVETGEVVSLSVRSAVVSAKVIDTGGGVSDYGHCYGTSSDPGIGGTRSSLGSLNQAGSYTSELNGLDAGVTYHVRAYITSGGETYYGKGITLATPDGRAELVTAEVTGIGVAGATCGGTVTSAGGDEILGRGICWDREEGFDLQDCEGSVAAGSGLGTFEGVMEDLEAGVTYGVRAYAFTSIDTAYGAVRSFTTRDGVVVFEQSVIDAVTTTSAECRSRIMYDGGSAVTARGVCWGTGVSPTISDQYTTDGEGTGSYTITITGLSKQTTYYARPYAINGTGTYYGGQVSFKTYGDAMLTTLTVTGIGISSATSGGDISGDGGAPILSKGVCWSTSQDPTINHSKTVDGSGPGNFSSVMTGLNLATTYYVRAYVTTAGDTYYGNQQLFTTRDGVVTLTTGSITGITISTAGSGGTISDDGGSAVTARGVCWSTSQNPTTSHNKTSNGIGPGSYTSQITGLSPNTTYYVRAYATNSVDTYYGNQQLFTTRDGVVTLTTGSITGVTSTSAVSGGIISDDGGSAVTARGVCWSTTQNPTTSHNKTSNGIGPGSYTSQITGLSPNTTYYVRAYATNSVDTYYGNQRPFTTPGQIPEVSTSTIGNITRTSATSGGSVTDDGGSTVTARGVCWSTAQYPTTGNSRTIDGGGTGVFTSQITGLTCGLTYYVRAYATNASGTGYGAQRLMTTVGCASPAVLTNSISNVTQTTADYAGNVTDDGGAVVTERGICWSTGSNPDIHDNRLADGSGTGSFSGTITGLEPNTTYYARAYAINSAGTGYGGSLIFTTDPPDDNTVTDIDGNVYQTVQIGAQTWMAENLRVTRYADGTSIQYVTDDNYWDNNALYSKLYGWYNDNSYYKNIYGALYNWPAVMNGASSSSSNPSGVQGVCPDGWHVPSDAEWTQLINYLGGSGVAGGKLKETGTTHWQAENVSATDLYGFSIRGNGYRTRWGADEQLRIEGTFWSATQYSSETAWYHGAYNFSGVMDRDAYTKKDGFGVRCLED